MLSPPAITHLFSKHSLSTYYMLDPVIDAGDTKMIKTQAHPLATQWGAQPESPHAVLAAVLGHPLSMGEDSVFQARPTLGRPQTM